MELGATLKDLIEGVQLEVGHSTNPLVGQNYRDTIAAAIRREYRRLHADFDWPHLLTWATESVDAGEPIQDLPEGADLSRVVQVWAKHPNGSWAQLCRGISVSDYNESDTDANAVRDPVLKWQPAGDDKIQIWPSPQTATQLRYVLKSGRLPLEVETDTCDLDTDLIVLFAAASLLFKSNSDRAGMVLQRGRNTYETLRQRLQTGGVRVRLGAL